MAFVNGRYVDEYNPQNYSYNQGGGQGLFNPSHQAVDWSQGAPSFDQGKTVAPGWLGGNYATQPMVARPQANAAAGGPTAQLQNNYPGTNVPIGGSSPYGTGGTPENVTRGFSGATLPGASPFNYNSAYGGIPQVPNPIGSQGDVLGGNIGNLGSLYNLATGVGSASAAGAGTQVEQNLPGFRAATGQSMGNISSLLKGEIPQDVQNLIAQQAAERGVMMGSPDSPNAGASLLRSLGLTSLGLQQQGEQNLSAAIGRTPTGPAFNPSSMLVTPAQQYEAQLLANYLAAAPIPSSAAAANMNALNRGIGRGQGAGGGGGGNQMPFPTGNTTTGSGALGFGFGTLGRNNVTGPGTGVFGGDFWNQPGPEMWNDNPGATTSNRTMPDAGYGTNDPSLGPTGRGEDYFGNVDFSTPGWEEFPYNQGTDYGTSGTTDSGLGPVTSDGQGYFGDIGNLDFSDPSWYQDVSGGSGVDDYSYIWGD